METKTSSPVRILIVDDEAVVQRSLSDWFKDEGYEVGVASSGKEALTMLASTEWDVFLLDIKMPGMDGLELQRRIRQHLPAASIVIMTAYASVESAVEALKQGAHDYITKPFDPEDLARIVRTAAERGRLVRENEALRTQIKEMSDVVEVVGESPAIRQVMNQVTQVAPTDATVLISGESGTGKEVIARAVHVASPRRYMPIIAVNCGALPEGVLESELFGHERGAFTGAQYRRKGRFEMADGGTLFLDEISDIPLKTQLDLLRVLEDRTITRIGSNRPIAVDFRVITATNRDLEEAVAAGRFREDLFYRINVFSISIPPLRERKSDIPLLVDHFIQKFSQAMNRPPKALSSAARTVLMEYDWPGNVRELQNAIERALVVSQAPELLPDDFPVLGQRRGGRGNGGLSPTGQSLASIEEFHVRRILQEADYNITQAAKTLGIDRVTLYNKMKRYGIRRPDQGE